MIITTNYMGNNIKAFICFFAVVLSISSFGQNKELGFFAGKWDFKIWFGSNTSGNPDLKAVWTLEKSLDSTECFTGYVNISGSVFTREMIALNTVQKEYIRTITTNNGAFIILKTKGWIGDKLTWVGTQYLAEQQTELKEEIVKSGQNEFKAVFYNLKNNKWIQTQTEVLTRII